MPPPEYVASTLGGVAGAVALGVIVENVLAIWFP